MEVEAQDGDGAADRSCNDVCAGSRQDQSTSSHALSMPSAGRLSGKRNSPSSGGPPGDEEDDGAQNPKRPCLRASSQGGPRYLACPFWKLDSTAHWECALKQIDTISHLKQHLTRRHTPKHYCQYCYDTFSDSDTLDTHVKARSCALGSPQRLGGVSYHQRDRLFKRLAPGSTRQQWIAIWDILFHNSPHPASIYIYPHNIVDIDRVREFSTQHGIEILAAELRATDLVLQPGVTADQLQEGLQRGLSLMLDRFIGDAASSSSAGGQPWRHRSNIGRPGSSNTSMSRTISIPTESITDSGLGPASPMPDIVDHDARHRGTEDPTQELAAAGDSHPTESSLLSDETQENYASNVPDLVMNNGELVAQNGMASDEQLAFEGMSDLSCWDLTLSLDEYIASITEAKGGRGGNA